MSSRIGTVSLQLETLYAQQLLLLLQLCSPTWTRSQTTAEHVVNDHTWQLKASTQEFSVKRLKPHFEEKMHYVYLVLVLCRRNSGLSQGPGLQAVRPRRIGPTLVPGTKSARNTRKNLPDLVLKKKRNPS
ncbi:unnamed protein product [Nesidiocoris tenuis]|uniref:Secreted protein n=1 Tax=Nesidiocoris tenuis TaxID=355587 RepID=A0A6H5HBU9_9HEMI|nr:unnamed protein product [Nesidiocoris tenuis]